MYTLGADVSFYQDDEETPQPIDFEKMKRGGIKFVIIRAGQSTWVDREFSTSWVNAKKAGIPRGSYWFYDSRSEPRAQARLWLKTLGNDLGELPLWCDFEDLYSGPYHGWKHWYDFMDELLKSAPIEKLGIYTGYYYWLDNTVEKQIPVTSLQWFSQFPLWIARYKADSPLVPVPWNDWTIWQYTDEGDGRFYGVESLELDMNYFNGSIEEFESRFGSVDIPQVTNGLRVRVGKIKE